MKNVIILMTVLFLASCGTKTNSSGNSNTSVNPFTSCAENEICPAAVSHDGNGDLVISFAATVGTSYYVSICDEKRANCQDYGQTNSVSCVNGNTCTSTFALPTNIVNGQLTLTSQGSYLNPNQTIRVFRR